MRLVVDASVLFSFFKPDSATRRLILTQELTLFTPKFVLEELDKHSEKIISSTGIDSTLYVFFRGIISGLVTVVPKGEFERMFEKARGMISDPEDIAYIALALKLGCPVWSEDPHFTKQSEVKVFNTADLAKMFLG